MADKIEEAFEAEFPGAAGDIADSGGRRAAFRAGFEACRAAALEALSKQDGGAFDLPSARTGYNCAITIMQMKLAALGKEPSDG